jgi:FAD/FMN-containing dehydrogenase
VPDERLLHELREIVGAEHVLTEADVRAPFERDWTGRFGGPCTCAVRPSAAREVAAGVRAGAGAHVPIVAQGGNTGLVGGGVPGPSGRPPVVLSATRLDGLGEVDADARQVTVGAGVVLADLQEHAGAAGLAVAVDFAARGSATVGGMIATNAGGIHVMAHGSMRAQVVGLEAVLADGTTISRLSGLTKDNTGYDLSQLLVGSEGTLAVVTAARLRLVEAAVHATAALIGFDDVTDAVAAVRTLRGDVTGIHAAELLFDGGLRLVCEQFGLAPPLPRPAAAYLLVEAAGRTDVTDALAAAIEHLGVAPERTAVAVDAAGRHRLWQYRELLTSAISATAVPHKFDVTVPVSRLAAFVPAVESAVARVAGGVQVVVFGHVADGNLHVNVSGPPPDDEAVDDVVLGEVARFGGSISAEHGIGRAKARWLHLSRSPAEIAAMQAIKRALDPGGVLNPGVLLADLTTS